MSVWAVRHDYISRLALMLGLIGLAARFESGLWTRAMQYMYCTVTIHSSILWRRSQSRPEED